VKEGTNILITPEQLPMVQTASMNDTHFETTELINKLSTAIQNSDVKAVNEAFEELFKHTKEHCETEEEMMVAQKFPPYLAHKEEHDLALDDMKKAAANFTQTEDFEAASKYLTLNLTPWFLQHTETMDAVTSMFLENSELHLEHWNRLKPRQK